MKEGVVDTQKEQDVSESMGEVLLKPSLIFPMPLEESNPDLLILHVNQSMMTASDGMKELDGFNFSIKAPEELKLSGFESILHLIPVLTGCCILHEADLVFFDKGHPQNFPKR